MPVSKTAFLVALLAVALIVGWWFVLRPASLGGPTTYVMVSGTSMEPTFNDGDLAVVRKHSSYAVGDIVAFSVERSIVIHRIVGGTAEEGFVVQGDNKSGPDTWRPTQQDVVGKMWFHAPGGGRFMALLRAPLPLATLAAALAMILVLSPPAWPWSPRRLSHRNDASSDEMKEA